MDLFCVNIQVLLQHVNCALQNKLFSRIPYFFFYSYFWSALCYQSLPKSLCLFIYISIYSFDVFIYRVSDPVGSGVLPGSGSGFQISLDPDPVSVLGSWIPDPDRDPRRTETAPIVIS